MYKLRELRRFRFHLIALFIVLVLIITAYSNTQNSSPQAFLLGCKERFGVGFAASTNNAKITDFEYKQINFSWYFDWWYEGSPIGDIQYVPMVGGWGWTGTLYPDCETLAKIVSENSSSYPNGTIWAIDNEPGHDSGFLPEDYARHYHYYYSCLKKINPTYKFIFGALSPDFSYETYRHVVSDADGKIKWEGRHTSYLIETAYAYQELYNETMPIDYYSLTFYIGDLKQNISLKEGFGRFRKAMKAIGAQDKPLLINEMGVMDENATYEEVIKSMYDSLDFFIFTKDKEIGMPSDGYRLAQKWAWYVFNGQKNNDAHTSLFSKDRNITPVGVAYANYIDNLNDDCSKKTSLTADDVIAQLRVDGLLNAR